MLTKMLPIHTKMKNIFENNLKTSKFKPLKNDKKKTNSFPLSPIFEIETKYKSKSSNISIGNNTSNISKQSEKYIQTTYAKEFFLEYSNFVTIWR